MRRLYCYLVVLSLLVSFTHASIAASAQTDAPAERLIYGDAVTRAFSATVDNYLFSFDAEQGDVVTITIVAANSTPPDPKAPPIDPALVLIGPGNQPVAQNDDSLDEKFGVTNARLVNYPIPASGTYLIKALRNAQSVPDGEFTLTLKGRHNGDARASVDFGSDVTGKIDSSTPTISYEFRAQRGDVISAEARSATSSDLAPSIALLDPGNTNVASTSSKSPGSALLKRVLILQDGIYTVVVSRNGLDKGTTSGEFQLSLRRDLQATLLNYGETDDDEITADAASISYVFQGKAGDVVTVSMFKKSGTLDPSLTLTNLDGKTLATNDNATGKDLKAHDARINRYKLPAAGIYVIVAGRSGGAKGTTKGKFTVALDVAKA